MEQSAANYTPKENDYSDLFTSSFCSPLWLFSQTFDPRVVQIFQVHVFKIQKTMQKF